MKTDAYTLIRVNLYIDTTGLAEKKFACSKACIKNAPKIGFFLGKEKGVFLASAMSHVIWKIVLGWKKGENLVYNGLTSNNLGTKSKTCPSFAIDLRYLMVRNRKDKQCAPAYF